MIYRIGTSCRQQTTALALYTPAAVHYAQELPTAQPMHGVGGRGLGDHPRVTDKQKKNPHALN